MPKFEYIILVHLAVTALLIAMEKNDQSCLEYQ